MELTTRNVRRHRRPRWLWVGLGGVVAAVVIGLVLVERAATTYGDGLDVTAESAAIVADAVAPIERIALDLVELTDVVESGLTNTREVVVTAQASAAGLSDAASGELAGIAEGLADVSDDVADVLETVENFIPGDIDSSAEDLRQIADNLAPAADELRELGAQLEEASQQMADVETDLIELEATVVALGEDIDSLTPSLQQVASAAEVLVDRVEAAQARVDTDIWLARILVVLIGAVLAIGLALSARRPMP